MVKRRVNFIADEGIEVLGDLWELAIPDKIVFCLKRQSR
jgi:hypothetical protein